MKTATLIAIIALLLRLCINLYYDLLSFGIVEPLTYENRNLIELINSFATLGLLIFFIQLYRGQSKN